MYRPSIRNLAHYPGSNSDSNPTSATYARISLDCVAVQWRRDRQNGRHTHKAGWRCGISLCRLRTRGGGRMTESTAVQAARGSEIGQGEEGGLHVIPACQAMRAARAPQLAGRGAPAAGSACSDAGTCDRVGRIPGSGRHDTRMRQAGKLVRDERGPCGAGDRIRSALARDLIARAAAPTPQIRTIAWQWADRIHGSDPIRARRPYDQPDHDAGRSAAWRHCNS